MIQSNSSEAIWNPIQGLVSDFKSLHLTPCFNTLLDLCHLWCQYLPCKFFVKVWALPCDGGEHNNRYTLQSFDQDWLLSELTIITKYDDYSTSLTHSHNPTPSNDRYLHLQMSNGRVTISLTRWKYAVYRLLMFRTISLHYWGPNQIKNGKASKM